MVQQIAEREQRVDERARAPARPRVVEIASASAMTAANAGSHKTDEQNEQQDAAAVAVEAGCAQPALRTTAASGR